MQCVRNILSVLPTACYGPNTLSVLAVADILPDVSHSSISDMLSYRIITICCKGVFLCSYGLVSGILACAILQASQGFITVPENIRFFWQRFVSISDALLKSAGRFVFRHSRAIMASLMKFFTMSPEAWNNGQE